MDLETLLTEATPARRVSLDGPDSPAAERLYERITSQAPGKAPERRRYLVRGITMAATAGAAAMVAIAVIPGSPASPGHPESAAASVLEAAAATAGHQPATAAAGPGQYEYVKTIQSERMAVGTGRGRWREWLDVQTVQDWVAPDGSGLQTASAQSPGGGIPASQTFRKGAEIDGLVYAYAADLPTDSVALEQFIVQHFEGGTSQVGATFQFAGTFLQSGAPPAVRAALYRLIEALPGVEPLGSMTDELGRHGIAVGYTTNGVRDVLIFDPSTSAVLEREGVVVDPAAVGSAPGMPRFRTGLVINSTVYVESGVVDSLTAVPSEETRHRGDITAPAADRVIFRPR